MSPRRRALILIVAAALAGAAAGILIGLGEDGGSNNTLGGLVTAGSPPPVTPPGTGHRAGTKDGGTLPPPEKDPQGLKPGPSGPLPSSQDERSAAGAARAYVRAINQREGTAVCRAFAPGALGALKLPVNRGSCDDSVTASLGYRPGGGQPVWQSSEMTHDVSAQVTGSTARVVATVFTKYADVREPTIEDDIIYLKRSHARWLVVKPSATLYRAVGIADVPLEALQPPG